MAKQITPLVTTNTFSAWLDKTNEIAGAFANVVSVDSANAALFPIGTAGVNGTFVSNNTIVSNGTITVTGASGNTTITNGAIVAPLSLSIGSLVSANSTHVLVGANTVISNGRVSVGNNTVNTAITSTSVTTSLLTLPSGTSFVTSGAISANGGIGSAGQILTSDGTKSYWASGGTGITSVSGNVAISTTTSNNAVFVNVVANNGIIANTAGLFVNAQSGLLANTSGLFVNASSIAVGTLPTGIVPNLDAGKITSGLIPTARLVSGTATGSGNMVLATAPTVSDLVITGNTTITKIVANGAIGTAAQALFANSVGGVYWGAVAGGGTVASFTFTDANGFTGSVATSTTTPTLTLDLQTANSTVSGKLSSTDWNTFNSKVGTTGTGATGTWGISISGTAASATSATSATTATNASNVAVSNDNASSSTVYPLWSSSTSGNGSAVVSSTKLSFVPSSGTLSATVFNGSLNGNASSATNAATAGGFTPSATSGTANRIVVADASGYINNSFFSSVDNGSSGAAGTVSSIMAKTGDNFLRAVTAASIATYLSGAAMNISGSSTSCSGTATNATQLGGTAAASYALKADVTFVGTTSIALNRTSGSQTLTGVSIDGNAATSSSCSGNAASASSVAWANVSGTSGVVQLRALSSTVGTSVTTLTPDAAKDYYEYDNLSGNITIANPTGTWGAGQGFVIALKSTAVRTISFGSAYAPMGSPLPTATVANKWIYIPVGYNSAAGGKHHVFAASKEA